ncbi:MAG: DUF6502 family protein [Woeseiaceae bacterium]
MQDKSRQRVLDAFLLVMRPIAKILLRYGISFNEFAETTKTAFVDVATSDYGIRGRPTNISRVAVMTGLTRKEVRRLRDKVNSGHEPVSDKSTPMTEILSRWHNEIDFLDEMGRPAALQFSGSSKSFSELVKRFGGDVPAGAMRTELKRVGSIAEDEEGNLKVIKRSVVPADYTDNLVTSLVHGVYPLLSTVALNSDPHREHDGVPQFTAYSLGIRNEDLTRLRRISYDRLSAAAESFDDLFMAYESPEVANQSRTSRAVSVGLYYFEEHDKNAKYKW